MIICLILIVLVQNSLLITSEPCFNSKRALRERYYSPSSGRYEFKSLLISSCSIEQVINPTEQYQFTNLENSPVNFYFPSKVNITIRNSLIANFSASMFVTDRIACFYDKISLLVDNAQVNNINDLPKEVFTTVVTNFIKGHKCNVTYESVQFLNNNITKLENDLFNNWPNLTAIKLVNNHIKFIDNLQFNNLPNLNALDLSNNEIPSLEMIFGKLDKLLSLNVSRNKIAHSLSNNAFINVTNLKYLNISHNQITNIVSGTFIHLNKLISLDISHNLIATIAIGVYSGLTNLIALNTSYNQLNMIGQYLLIDTPNLRDLDLSFNSLESMDVNALMGHNLKNINIDGNRFSCQQLNLYISKLKQMRIKLNFGNEKARSSLYGIHCNDSMSNEDIAMNVVNDISGDLNDMRTFFTSGFNNTSFFKFFSNFPMEMEPLDQRDARKSSADVDAAHEFLELFNQLRAEVQRFDNDTDQLTQHISDKLEQTYQIPVENHEASIFNTQIVIICFLAFLSIVLVMNMLYKNVGAWRSFRHNRVHDDTVSRTELCSMTTDTL